MVAPLTDYKVWQICIALIFLNCDAPSDSEAFRMHTYYRGVTCEDGSGVGRAAWRVVGLHGSWSRAFVPAASTWHAMLSIRNLPEYK